MARLDKVKNLTGLAEWYAQNERLRGLVNLVIVGEYTLGVEGAAGGAPPCCWRRACAGTTASVPKQHRPRLLGPRPCPPGRLKLPACCPCCHPCNKMHHLPAGGVIDPDATMDREEADECRKMHGIVEQYNMKPCFRWIVAQARPPCPPGAHAPCTCSEVSTCSLARGSNRPAAFCAPSFRPCPQKNRVRNGELYRYIADTGGAFAQPALYEGGCAGKEWLGAVRCPRCELAARDVAS